MRIMTQYSIPSVSLGGDIISALAVIFSFLGYLPLVSAFAGLIWFCIQIWESRTVQHWYNNRKMIQRAKKITKLRAKEKIIVAELEALELVRAAKHEATERVELAKVEAATTLVHEQTTMETK